ncbi:MAG: 3-dehydroquinate synthase [Clostridia bacterium]|nr:3-dehydroquinate synthase [Clostridia bacterium]
MEKLTVRVNPAYNVLLESGLLRQAGVLTAQAVRGRHVMIVTDDGVAPLYLDAARTSFASAGFTVDSFVFPQGESHKTLQTIEALLNAADEAGITRSDLFAALGGGLTGDLAGLAAALYLRGVDFVQIPTSLLAMVDASVGGKTAVNLPSGKNLCGAFYQPRLVVCDPDTLNTLSPALYAEGMAEVIKYGAICDGALLSRIARGEDMTAIIADCIRIKGEIVCQDEHDHGQRQLLNLGHTFGHALEKLNGYAIYHGEGVAVGMLIAAFAAERHGLCEAGVYAELQSMLAAQKLPVSTAFAAREIAANAMNDKKRKGDSLTLVLPTRRGKSALHILPARELASFIACCDGEVTAV